MEMLIMMGASALIGAAGNIFGSMQSSKAQQQAIDTMSQMFGIARSDILNMFQTGKLSLDPYIKAGAGTLDTLKSLLTPGPDQINTLKQLPGYQFMMDSMNAGVLGPLNAGTVRGLGPNTTRELQNYAGGVAQTAFGSFVDPLMKLAGIGETAAGQEAGLAGTTESALGNLGATFGGNIGGAQVGKGSALAGGITGATGAVAGGLQNIGLWNWINSKMSGQQQQTSTAYGIPNPATTPDMYASTVEGLG